MKYKVGDKVKIKEGSLKGNICTISHIESCKHIELYDLPYVFFDYELEPVGSTLAEIKEKELTCCINARSIAEAQFLDDFFECKSYLKKYCENAYKERMRLGYYRVLEDGVAFQLTDGVINDNCSANFYRSCGGRYGEVYEFSDLFPVGSTMMCGDRMYQHTESGIKNYKLVPEYKENSIVTLKPRDESVSFASAPYLDLSLILPTNSRELEEKFNEELIVTAESISHITGIPYENSINKLKTCLSAFSNDGISAKNGGKNSMKFTFYVKEGTRPDKKCNGLIPTMTTTVVDASGKKATVTCDKADYSERQGVLEAIAQMACGGNFDKEYDKAVKKNKLIELHDRTCTYCGKVFDTIAEREAHEAWHVERKKARQERYLLRKRAKEIAFEEQAQKMAKEMMGEQK